MSTQNRFLRKLTDAILSQLGSTISRAASSNKKSLETSMILQGRTLALQNNYRAPLKNIQDAEFKVFSQFGEDGILQYLVHETAIKTSERIFVEFGVQDYSESNSRFLLMNNHWKGLILDGSREYMDSVRNSDIYWRHDITAVNAWIDKDNINQLISEAGFGGEIGILSVDIDGNDYWVWEKIQIIDPVIVVVEWNSVFGDTHTISVPYDPKFSREEKHYSCLYWGASIAAFDYLAQQKGYRLICSNSAGNNLFFVRQDRLNHLQPRNPQEAYVESSFRDSRDEAGKLNYLAGETRKQEILDLAVVDVKNGETTTLRKLEK